MSDLLKIAVEKWCDEVRAHDNWTWGNTCVWLMDNIDYRATSSISRELILVTFMDGKHAELLRLEHGWGIRWGVEIVSPANSI